MLVNLT